MAKDVKIRITAQDKTKKALLSVRGNLKSLGRVAGSVSRSVSNAMRGIGRAARNAVLATGAGLAAIGVSSIKAAADAEEVRSKFLAVFKDTSDGVRAWAIDFGKNVNRATIDVQRMLSAVQDLFVPLGFSRKEAAAFSKSVATLAVDLASFNNVADDVALKAIQSALVGNSETVRQFGIILTEANIAQEAFESGLSKTTKEVSNQAKVMARLQLIQKGSTDAQGDAIRTANGLTNVWKGLSAAVKTAKIEIGQQLIVGLGLAANFKDLTSKVADFTKSLADSGAIEMFADDALTALKPVKEFFEDIFAGGDARSEALERLKNVGLELATRATDVLMAKAPMIGEAIGNAILKGFLFGAKNAPKAAARSGFVIGKAKASTAIESARAGRATSFAGTIASGGAEADIRRTERQIQELVKIKDELIKLKQE